MSKSNKSAAIAIDLEFEATKTNVENVVKKSPATDDGLSIAFNLDPELLTKVHEKDEELDLSNLAKTQKSESKIEDTFAAFSISDEELVNISNQTNQDKTQATMLFKPEMLEQLKPKTPEKVEAKVNNKTDSKIHINVEKIGFKKDSSKNKYESQSLRDSGTVTNLNLLDDLDSVEDVEPESILASSPDIQDSSEQSINDVEDYSLVDEDENIFENISELDLLEEESDFSLENDPSGEVDTLMEGAETLPQSIEVIEDSDDINEVEVHLKGNELELSSDSDMNFELGSDDESVIAPSNHEYHNEIEIGNDSIVDFKIDLKSEVEETPVVAPIGEKASSRTSMDKSEVISQEELVSLQQQIEVAEELDKVEFSFEETTEFTFDAEEKADKFNDDNQFVEESLEDVVSMSEIETPLQEFNYSKVDNVEGDEEEFDLASFREEIASEVSEVEQQPLNKKTSQTESLANINEYRQSREKIIIEESNVGSTIRELREDRENLLSRIDLVNSQLRESEQTLLTIRASLEESKIENSILKKRHQRDIEENRYKLEVYEERMLKAEEVAKYSNEKVVKLQQSIRIDFNQVKQREKELESKLELLMIDFENQIKSRDQKILDLRRKIDSLEFNLESANLREQKSLDDKKRLEERLNKIMKTLKHSLHTLEDEVESVEVKDQIKRR